ncbi:hypothetical protein ACFL1M_01965 [Patescibacteria group bacterium]
MKLPSFSIFGGQKNKEDDYNPFPDLPAQKTIPKVGKEYILLGFAFLLFVVALFIYLNQTKESNLFGPPLSNPSSNSKTKLDPTPTPKPLPNGAQTYNYSHGNQVVGPKPTKVIIDPIDPNQGQKQTLTLKIPHDKPITNATATLNTDNNQKESKFENNGGDLWIAEWIVDDSYEYTYKIKFEIQDSQETFSGDLTFR